MQVIGGIVGGLDIWEMAVIPMLLNNADVWTEIDANAVKELEYLQNLFLAVLMNVPMTGPQLALCWDTGTSKMENGIKMMKLKLIIHIKKLSNNSLANQVYKEQLKNDWPGLAKESQAICEEFRLKDVTKEWTFEPKKNKWKSMIKEACVSKNERDMKKEIKYKYKKITEMSSEKFERKNYLSEMTMEDARMFFKIRTKMVKAKMNFSNDYRNKESLWKCDSCCRNIDTQAHITICPAYSHLREGKSLGSDKDLVQYFREVLSLREKNNVAR